MEQWKAKDINPEDGKIFAYVYTGDGDTFELQTKAYDMFCGQYLSDNMNPSCIVWILFYMFCFGFIHNFTGFPIQTKPVTL